MVQEKGVCRTRNIQHLKPQPTLEASKTELLGRNSQVPNDCKLLQTVANHFKLLQTVLNHTADGQNPA